MLTNEGMLETCGVCVKSPTVECRGDVNREPIVMSPN